MLSTLRFAAPPAGLRAPFQAGICALVLLVPSLLGLAGCGSSGPTAAELGRTTNTAGEIVLFTDGHQMSLISEAMLERLDVPGKTPDERTMNFYSEERASATAKVAPNDAVTGFLQFLSQGGFDDWATPGVHDGNSIVVKVNDDIRSMPRPSGPMADPDQYEQYVEFMNMFANVYNAIEARQNVAGNVRFEKPVLSKRLLKDAGVSGAGVSGGGGSR